MRRTFLSLVIAVMLAAPLAAQVPQLTAAQEQEAKEIGREMRCVVCQNQSIEDSDAELAEDMRALVRERIAAGQSRAQIISYMRDSYGDVILLKPPVQANTYILWGAPFALLGAAFIWLWRRRKSVPVKAEALSAHEQERLTQLKREHDS